MTTKTASVLDRMTLSMELLESVRKDKQARSIPTPTLFDAKPRDQGEWRQRKTPRFKTPALHVFIGDKIFGSINWSIDGVLISGYDGPLTPGDKVPVSLTTGVESADARKAIARVLRTDRANHQLTLKYMSITKITLAWLIDLQRFRHKIENGAY